jgi:hypothetical protein
MKLGNLATMGMGALQHKVLGKRTPLVVSISLTSSEAIFPGPVENLAFVNREL